MWRLRLGAWGLVPAASIWPRLGACSSLRGPNLFQDPAIWWSSNRSVDHWPTLQFLTVKVTRLVKQHHVFFSKVLSEEIDPIAHDLPAILVITEARLLVRCLVDQFHYVVLMYRIIIHRRRECRQLDGLTAERVRPCCHLCRMSLNFKRQFHLFSFIVYCCHNSYPIIYGTGCQACSLGLGARGPTLPPP